MAVNEVIDHLRLQNLRKHFIVNELKADRLCLKAKCVVPCCLVVGDHFLRDRFLRLLIRVQYMLDQLQDLSLHLPNLLRQMIQIRPGQHVLCIAIE